MKDKRDMPVSDSSRNPAPDLRQAAVHHSLDRYWRSNLRITVSLLIVWAFTGLGCGILFADFLNKFRLPGTGYPLGFWFAQQGSILVFVILIGIYCLFMNRLDRRHHGELEQLRREEGQK